jgi:hypothetical protein
MNAAPELLLVWGVKGVELPSRAEEPIALELSSPKPEKKL